MAHLFMKITADKYELPIYVADTARELAEICGTSTNAVFSAIAHRNNDGKKSTYIRVDFEEDENV